MIKLKRIKLESLEDAMLNEQEMKQIVGGNSNSSGHSTFTVPSFTNPTDAIKNYATTPYPTYTMRAH